MTDPKHAASVSDDDYAGYGEILERLTQENASLREAIASAMTSLATGPMKDGYAYSVLEEALES